MRHKPSISWGLALFAPLFLIAAETASIEKTAGGNFRRRATVGQYDRVIPLLLVGQGARTAVTLTNLDAATIYWDVYFSDNSGNPLTVQITDLGKTSELYGTLPVNQSVTFELEGGSDLQEGFLNFFTLDRRADDPQANVTPARIGGLAVIRATPPDRAPFEVTVPVSPMYETKFSVPFDNRNGFQTGIILLNPSAKPSPVKVTLRSPLGGIMKQDAFTLAPHQRVTGFLPDIYPESANNRGTIQVSTSAIGLSGLALRFDPTGAFIAIPTMSSDVDLDAPTRPSNPTSSLPGIAASCAALEGTLVFANDGTFIGKITGNSADPDSMGNRFGKYGSDFSTLSIFNQFGKYGGDFSALSPFNPFTTTPPVIFARGNGVAYLTANASRTPRVAPQAIFPCIGR